EADPVVVLVLDRPAKARAVEPPSAPQVSDAQRDDGYVRIHRLLLGKVQDHSTNVCSYHPGSIANVLLSRAVLAIFSLNLRVRVPTLSLATGEAAMAARPATAAQKAQRELEDLQLVVRARNGDGSALDVLI